MIVNNIHSKDMLMLRDWSIDDSNPKYEEFIKCINHHRANIERWGSYINMFNELAKKYLSLNRKITVLDIACGMGFTVLELAKLGYKTVGLDFNPNHCKIAREAGKYFNTQAKFCIGDACELPFRSESFDIVMSTSFFEHVYDPDKALLEQIRVLTKGGLLFILDGNLLSPKQFIDLLFLYPLRTRFKYGGLKWLFSKNRIRKNLYGYLDRGRDEDIHTVFWWKRKLRRYGCMELLEGGTDMKYLLPSVPRFLWTFGRCCLLVMRKK